MEQQDINKVALGVKVFGAVLVSVLVGLFVFSMTSAGESCYQNSLQKFSPIKDAGLVD